MSSEATPDPYVGRVHAMTVYRYGTPSWVTATPEVGVQLRLAHDLREDMVSLEHGREQAVKDVWSAYPGVAGAEAALAEAEARAGELAEQLKAEKSAQRTRAPKTPTAAALRAVRAEAAAARVARRAAIAEVREDAKARLDELTAGHRAAMKALYADYVQTRGLYWATYNDVADHHRAAVRRIGALRAGGRPAALRHHRFDGTGSLAVQLQRQAGDPERSPALLASGQGKWRNVLRIHPWVDPAEFDALSRAEQRARSRGVATVNIGNSTTIDVPVIVHRMLPPDADVTGARLVLRRTAGHVSTSLCVTARVPQPDPVQTGPTVAVHFGWRRVDDDGSLRVATWRADRELPVPKDLADVVQADGDGHGIVLLAGRHRAAAERHTRIASARDLAFDKIRATIIDWLTDNPPATAGAHPPPGPDGDRPWPTAADVARWRSPGRIVHWARRLTMAASSLPPDPDRDDLLAEVEAWRRTDRQRWEGQAHGREKTLGRRNDAWSRVAAWLSRTAARIVLDDTVITDLAADTETSIPTAVTVIPVQQRIDAAPGGLRAAIRTAAVREGVTITVVPHAGVTRTHAACGHTNPADDRYAHSIVVTCDGCGRSYDQDRNATILMLTTAR